MGVVYRDTRSSVRRERHTMIAHLKKLKPVNFNPQAIQAVMAQYEVEGGCVQGVSSDLMSGIKSNNGDCVIRGNPS